MIRGNDWSESRKEPCKKIEKLSGNKLGKVTHNKLGKAAAMRLGKVTGNKLGMATGRKLEKVWIEIRKGYLQETRKRCLL